MDEKRGKYVEEIAEGMTAVFAKTVTEADIVLFAGVSGDTNPVHLDEDFARTTIFKGRIAHGMLSAGFISTVFGTKLPGPGCIYLSQSLKFKAPVRIGDTVVTTATVREVVGREVIMDCACTVDGKQVLESEARVLAPRRPAPKA